MREKLEIMCMSQLSLKGFETFGTCFFQSEYNGPSKVLHKLSVIRASLCWSNFEMDVWNALLKTVEYVSAAVTVF